MQHFEDMQTKTAVELVTKAHHEATRELDAQQRERNAWRRFGTIGYEAYVAYVLRQVREART